MSRVPLDPDNLTGSPSLVVLAALRAHLGAGLGLPDRLIGGWEMLAARRDAVLSVYTNSGESGLRAGSVTHRTEEIEAAFIVRTGSSPLHEEELFPVRDALTEMLTRFSHAALAGITVSNWSFDIQQDGGFTNILKVQAKAAYRSRPVEYARPENVRLGLAQRVVASILQAPITPEG